MHDVEQKDSGAGRALMRRELEEQIDLLPAIAAQLEAAGTDLRPRPGTTISAVGCGDSLFAAEALAPHFRTAGHGFRAVSSAELLWEGEVAEGDTVVAVSISGSTRRTVEATADARSRGARTIAVTIGGDSALAQAAEATLLLPYRPISREIPHGLDYHVTLLALAALASPLGDLDMGDLFARETPNAVARAEAAAADLAAEARYFFLGGGSAARGTAAFAAAKMHEAAGLPAWFFEADNFGHGAHFMLRPGDHVGLFGGGGPADRRTLALTQGLHRLGCTVIEAGFVAVDAPNAALHAALLGALHAQALCLAVAERLDLDVSDPARGGPASEVQRDWFNWQA